MRKRVFYKVITFVLAFTLFLGAVPSQVFANDDTTSTNETSELEASSDESLVVANTEGDEQNLVTSEEESKKTIKVGDSIGTNGYYKVHTRKDWVLVPGAATETEIVVNNAAGTRRQVLHIIEVDPSNPDVSIVPGYYQIDKDLDNEANWSHKELTEMAKYYENNLGYNIVGGMNTDLYYSSYSPRVLVYNGKSIGNFGENVATGGAVLGATSSILYVFKDADGNVSCEVTAFNKTDFDNYLASGKLLHAVGVSFGMVVKDGKLVNTTEKRGNDDAARSMVGIKPDGTLVICMNDGRGANNSVGLSSYEEGEIMLELGCQWAANCDGGGSSTFLTKRVGEETFTMRSVPCDGAQRPTAHGVFVVSNVGPTGELDVININSDYDYFAPNTEFKFGAEAIDTHGYAMNMPANITWTLSDDSFGTINDGVFKSNGKKGAVVVNVAVNGTVVGSKTINVADPEVFKLSATSTVIPYSTEEKVRTITLPIVAMIGEANVYYDLNAVSVTLSNENAGILDGFKFTATSDTSISGVNVTVKYGDIALTYAIEFGKGSEVIYNFENGDKAGFVGFEEAKKWSQDKGVNNTLVGAEPLAGQFNAYLSSKTFVASKENGGQVRNGKYALAWKLDNTNANFGNWSYNVLFNVGETIVLRDVANGMKATTLGMWLYIPEEAFSTGTAGVAFQSQLYVKNADGTYSCKQDHFMFTSALTGKSTNLNSATNADVPESRWVYATIDISKYDYLCTPVASDVSNSRSPSFIRTYVKPTLPSEVTFYIDDITLDYSSAVDDRVLPTITNPTYSTSDVAVTLNNETKIDGNKVAFAATVADNAALDTTTGKIYVDGKEVIATVQGSVLSCQDVTLTSGKHTVKFEIKDELGNMAAIYRTFEVNGTPVVELTGHNDSSEAAKAQSIYYVDVKVDDITKVNKLVTDIKLNNANKWETEGSVVANGFKATYVYNEVSELLTITVELEDAKKVNAEDTVLISIPARVWTYDRYSYVNNSYYDPAKYADGTEKDLSNKPTVNIECEMTYGEVTLANGDTYTVGGNINVATELTTISSPYHLHDAELTVLNKEATVYESGYENRTYCETCKSVVDWGTILERIGHTYVIENGQFVCSCDGEKHVYESGTGIFELNDKLYYSFANVLQAGWQTVEDGYCYADSKTYELAVGEKTISGLTYTFDENAILVKGAWVTDSVGTKYSFGPGFYRRTWQEIEGYKYYFGEDYYIYTGLRSIEVNRSNMEEGIYWYEFAEDGKYIKDATYFTGIHEYKGKPWYVKDGKNYYGGLMLIDGNYYYARSSGEIVCNRAYYTSKTNDLLPVDTYTFDAEGKMVNAPVINPDQPDQPVEPEKPDQPVEPEKPEGKNGIFEENGTKYYYENDVKTYGGLMLIDGNYYYARSSGEIVCNRAYYTSKTNDLLPVDTYVFDAEGKMIIK